MTGNIDHITRQIKQPFLAVFQSARIKLYQAIQEWDSLERKDVEHLFADDVLVLTDPEEIRVIKELRKKRGMGGPVE